VKSHSELKLFTNAEIDLLHRAERLVELVPDLPEDIRCHELSRAVGRVMRLQHQDGYYGFVDHTWLWTTPFTANVLNQQSRLGFPNILDVYAVGSLPIVRLVDAQHPSLPHVGWGYRPGKDRTDINESVIETLVEIMEHAPPTSSTLRAWTPALVGKFLDALSATAINILHVLRVAYPSPLTAEDVVRQGAADGTRGVGPAIAGVERLAAAMDLPSPVIVEKTRYGLSYSMELTFGSMFDNAVRLGRVIRTGAK